MVSATPAAFSNFNSRCYDMGGWIGGQSEYVMVPYADFNLLKAGRGGGVVVMCGCPLARHILVVHRYTNMSRGGGVSAGGRGGPQLCTGYSMIKQ